jgi:hypothetical protein
MTDLTPAGSDFLNASIFDNGNVGAAGAAGVRGIAGAIRTGGINDISP